MNFTSQREFRKQRAAFEASYTSLIGLIKKMARAVPRKLAMISTNRYKIP